MEMVRKGDIMEMGRKGKENDKNGEEEEEEKNDDGEGGGGQMRNCGKTMGNV